jgi:hypothetical protein
MQLPDVNVLIYAHREDAPEHERYAAWLRALTESEEPFAMSAGVISRASPACAGDIRSLPDHFLRERDRRGGTNEAVNHSFPPGV